MKHHTLLFFSLIVLLSGLSVYADPQHSNEATANNASQEIKTSSDTALISNITQIQKPTESEAIQAAIQYLNRDGRLTVQKSEFLAWGTYSEEHLYWPVKFRLSYKSKGSESIRQNEYAMKISKDSNGKWKAEKYWAWRTDFK